MQDIETIVDLKLVNLVHHKKRLVDVKEYGVKYRDGEDGGFRGETFVIEKGDRIALSGANGCGKTTLIKVLLSKCGFAADAILVEEEGAFEVASGLQVSYVGQETRHLKGSLSDYCEEQALDQSLFYAILRQLDFEREQFSKNMESFSEGQKKKVLLSTSLLTPAHLYIWDEPLNYIDIYSRMQLEKLILQYEPTILFVEHDSAFRKKIANKTIAL